MAVISAKGDPQQHAHQSFGVQTVDIWADLDQSGTGGKAAGELAGHAHEAKKTVYLRLPAGPIPEGQKSRDWLDVLNSDGPGIISTRIGTRGALATSSIGHTFASLLLTAGAPIAYMSEQMGHSSID